MPWRQDRPAKACFECRLLDIRCDRKKPRCSQCSRSGRDCPGYTSMGPIWYRDQLKYNRMTRPRLVYKPNVRMRIPARPKRSPTPMFQIQATTISPSSDISDGSVFSNLSNALVPSLNDRAIPFFLSNFVAEAQTMPGFLVFVRSVFSSAPSDGVLGAVLVALGTAGLGRKLHSQDIVALARLKYGAALRLINAALQDPIKVKENQTLAAIMIVPLYETITGETRQWLKSWQYHMAGSMALIAIRGLGQFQTKIGRVLFRHLRTQIVFTCLYHRQPVPRAVRFWNGQAEGFVQDYEDVAKQRLIDIAARLSSISASSVLEKKPSSSAIVKACVAVNAQLKKWAEEVSPELVYVTIQSAPSKNVWGSSYHVYKNLVSSSSWSLYRAMRMISSGLLVDCLNPKDSSALILYNQSVTALEETVAEIFASVPYHMNAHRSEPLEPPAVAGMFIFWNLFNAATKESATPAMREWAIEKLDEMGTTMGIQQGNALAGFLKFGPPGGHHRKPPKDVSGPEGDQNSKSEDSFGGTKNEKPLKANASAAESAQVKGSTEKLVSENLWKPDWSDTTLKPHEVKRLPTLGHMAGPSNTTESAYKHRHRSSI